MTTKLKYDEYSTIATQILKEISTTYSIKTVDIRWENFVHLLREKYAISIAAYKDFAGNLAHIFAGSLLVTSAGSAIGYNATSFQVSGRRRFTIVHEGVHFICDAQRGKVSQSFSDLLKNKNYSTVELQEEDNANFVASLLMCNDLALVSSMRNGDNIRDFCAKFGFTHAAAWTRIYNYLFYSFGIPSHRAAVLANAYASGEELERQTFLNVLISNKSSFWNYMDTQTSFSNLEFSKLSNEWNDRVSTSSHFYQFQNLVDDLYRINGKICSSCGRTFYGRANYKFNPNKPGIFQWQSVDDVFLMAVD
ncbi:hypothetical protein [Lactiplantibacillus carotarum]|uniref:hypothetical protein n=1 Tax=Lactiplantibacillus carotarum TaxID=2993456 RepID=UPI00298F0FC5|nr:hypothetical protein [Lactiplantibacillus carotarum]